MLQLQSLLGKQATAAASTKRTEKKLQSQAELSSLFILSFPILFVI